MKSFVFASNPRLILKYEAKGFFECQAPHCKCHLLLMLGKRKVKITILLPSPANDGILRHPFRSPHSSSSVFFFSHSLSISSIYFIGLGGISLDLRHKISKNELFSTSRPVPVRFMHGFPMKLFGFLCVEHLLTIWTLESA